MKMKKQHKHLLIALAVVGLAYYLHKSGKLSLGGKKKCANCDAETEGSAEVATDASATSSYSGQARVGADTAYLS